MLRGTTQAELSLGEQDLTCVIKLEVSYEFFWF